jgi:hypothetical protein
MNKSCDKEDGTKDEFLYNDPYKELDAYKDRDTNQGKDKTRFVPNPTNFRQVRVRVKIRVGNRVRVEGGAGES